MALSHKQLSIIRHVLGYTAGTIMTVLAMRSLLMLLSAGTGNTFVDTVYAASSAFAWPFSLLFEPVRHGQWNIDVASLVGLMSYALILIVAMRVTAYFDAKREA